MLDRDRFGGGSLVVLGGKMGDQKTYFFVMQDNFNALYRRRLASSCHTISPKQGTGVTNQYDDARPYYALIVRQFLAQKSAYVLPCTVVSPDPMPL